VFPVPGVHLPNHLRCDFLRRQPGAQVMAEVAGPFPGAHAHQPLLRVRGPMTAMRGHHLPAHLLPYRLGVDQHPIQVEYDRLDHPSTLPLPAEAGQGGSTHTQSHGSSGDFCGHSASAGGNARVLLQPSPR
jgi:hypothetical protein